MKGITTIASLPGSGAGSMGALTVERVQSPAIRGLRPLQNAINRARREVKRPTMSERAPELLKGLKENGC